MNVPLRQAEFGNDRLSQLLAGPVRFLEDRIMGCQERVLQQTVSDLEAGVRAGRWDVATAGGKGAMAMSLAHHVVENGGRVLFVTDGTTEQTELVKKYFKYKLDPGKFLRAQGAEGIKSMSDNRCGYVFANTQTLSRDDRLKKIDPHMFDLVFFEESQGYFGDVYGLPKGHFSGAQIHMSATPFTINHHLAATVPHQFGEITRQELVRDYGYPERVIVNHHVNDFDYADATPVSMLEELNFDSPRQHRRLNMGRRFQILSKICEEVVLSGNKMIAFMPSVKDAEDFCRIVLPTNPIIASQFDWMASSRHADLNYELEERLRDGDLRGLIAKDKGSKALDIDDITDVVLGAPTRSLERLIQREGRGARWFEGKTHYRVHDLVSSFFHATLHQGRNTAIQVAQAAQLEANMRRQYVVPNLPRPDLAQVAREAELVTSGEVNTVEFTGEVTHLAFMGDKKWALKVFEAFAHEVFLVSLPQLMLNWDLYAHRLETISVDWNDNSIPVTLAEARAAAEFFNTWEACENHDYVAALAASYQAKAGAVVEESALVKSRHKTIVPAEAKAEISPKKSFDVMRFEADLKNLSQNLDLEELSLSDDIEAEMINIERAGKHLSCEIGLVLPPQLFEEAAGEKVKFSLTTEDLNETGLLKAVAQTEALSLSLTEAEKANFLLIMSRIFSDFVETAQNKPKSGMDKVVRRLAASHFVQARAGKTENLRDEDFTAVRQTKPKELFMTLSSRGRQVFYVLSHNGVVHQYEEVVNAEGETFFICLNDDGVDTFRTQKYPNDRQTVRFFDQTGQNALNLTHLFPEARKIKFKPGKKNFKYQMKTPFTAGRCYGGFYRAKDDDQPVVVFDGDSVEIIESSDREIFTLADAARAETEKTHAAIAKKYEGLPWLFFFAKAMEEHPGFALREMETLSVDQLYKLLKDKGISLSIVVALIVWCAGRRERDRLINEEITYSKGFLVPAQWGLEMLLNAQSAGVFEPNSPAMKLLEKQFVGEQDEIGLREARFAARQRSTENIDPRLAAIENAFGAASLDEIFLMGLDYSKLGRVGPKLADEVLGHPKISLSAKVALVQSLVDYTDVTVLPNFLALFRGMPADDAKCFLEPLGAISDDFFAEFEEDPAIDVSVKLLLANKDLGPELGRRKPKA